MYFFPGNGNPEDLEEAEESEAVAELVDRNHVNWENAVDLLKMYRVILSSVSEEFQRNSEER